jgi:hypothetical protein
MARSTWYAVILDPRDQMIDNLITVFCHYMFPAVAFHNQPQAQCRLSPTMLLPWFGCEFIQLFGSFRTCLRHALAPLTNRDTMQLCRRVHINQRFGTVSTACIDRRSGPSEPLRLKVTEEVTCTAYAADKPLPVWLWLAARCQPFCSQADVPQPRLYTVVNSIVRRWKGALRLGTLDVYFQLKYLKIGRIFGPVDRAEFQALRCDVE